jgi:hypothetical protein
MKHTLSSFRRSSLLRMLCLGMLAFMLAPAAMAASSPTNLGGINSTAASKVGGLAGAAALLAAAPVFIAGKKEGEESSENLAPAEALAAVENKALPMSQRLSIAAKTLRGIDPTNQLADMQGKLTASETLAAERLTKLTAAESQLAARTADVATLEASNATLEAANAALTTKEQDLEKRVASKSKESLGALGFNAAELPKTTDANAPGASASYADAVKHYGSLNDAKEASAYYANVIQPMLDARK